VSATRTAHVIPLPPPYQGQFDRYPVAVMQSPYCEQLQNFNIQDGVVKIRNGDLLFCTISTTTGRTARNLSVYADTTLIAVEIDPTLGAVWYDISTGTASSVYTNAGVLTTGSIFTTEFGGCIYYWGDGELSAAAIYGVRFDGTSWTTAPYTIPASFVPFGGTVHRNRHYLLGRASAKYCYSGIDAISGALTQVDLATVFQRKGNLIAIRSLSISDSGISNSLFCVVNSSGEVLFYEGAYPASSDWRLVNRSIISKPLDYGSIIDVRGDLLVLTEAGIISMKDLFLKGSQLALEESISSPIRNRWRQIFKDLAPLSGITPTNSIRGLWHSRDGKIQVQIPIYIARPDSTSGSTQLASFFLVYDIDSKGWAEHVGNDLNGSNIYSSVYFNGDVYFSNAYQAKIYKKEGKSDSRQDIPDGHSSFTYPASIKFAPFPISTTAVNRLVGVEVIAKGNWGKFSSIRLIADMGRTTTGGVTLSDFIDTTSVFKKLVSVGVEGTYIQLYLQINQLLVGAFELYGVNAIFESGGIG